MERLIDFSRDRHMLCGSCGQRFLVDLDWIDRWQQEQEKCPGCALTCEHEDAPRVTVDPADPALDDDHVARLSWYHTSTHPDWPTKDFDPAADLIAETRQLMGGDLRRGRDQAHQGSQFYLYRVILVVGSRLGADRRMQRGQIVSQLRNLDAGQPSTPRGPKPQMLLNRVR